MFPFGIKIPKKKKPIRKNGKKRKIIRRGERLNSAAATVTLPLPFAVNVFRAIERHQKRDENDKLDILTKSEHKVFKL